MLTTSASRVIAGVLSTVVGLPMPSRALPPLRICEIGIRLLALAVEAYISLLARSSDPSVCR